jgi:hypothetical protein
MLLDGSLFKGPSIASKHITLLRSSSAGCILNNKKQFQQKNIIEYFIARRIEVTAKNDMIYNFYLPMARFKHSAVLPISLAWSPR